MGPYLIYLFTKMSFRKKLILEALQNNGKGLINAFRPNPFLKTFHLPKEYRPSPGSMEKRQFPADFAEKAETLSSNKYYKTHQNSPLDAKQRRIIYVLPDGKAEEYAKNVEEVSKNEAVFEFETLPQTKFASTMTESKVPTNPPVVSLKKYNLKFYF